MGADVENVYDGVFSGCNNIEYLELYCKNINYWVNSFKKSVREIKIGSTVERVAKGAFQDFVVLEKCEFENGKMCQIDFENEYANPLYYTKHLIIGGKEVTEFYVPEDVEQIGSYAFVNCTGLTKVEGLKNLTRIGAGAFMGCEKLRTIGIPDGVTKIEKHTFYDCKRMTEIRIGTGVESIENMAFNGCPLVRIYNYAEFPQDCPTNVFSIVKPNCKLYVMEDSQDLYRVHKDWYEFDIQPMDAEALPVEAIENGDLPIGITYDLNGRNLSQTKKGLNIIRFPDGTTKKVMIR